MNNTTAVTWLINQLKKSRDYQRVINEVNLFSTQEQDIIKIAKEMEIRQTIDFALDFFNKNTNRK